MIIQPNCYIYKYTKSNVTRNYQLRFVLPRICVDRFKRFKCIYICGLLITTYSHLHYLFTPSWLAWTISPTCSHLPTCSHHQHLLTPSPHPHATNTFPHLQYVSTALLHAHIISVCSHLNNLSTPSSAIHTISTCPQYLLAPSLPDPTTTIFSHYH